MGPASTPLFVGDVRDERVYIAPLQHAAVRWLQAIQLVAVDTKLEIPAVLEVPFHRDGLESHRD